MYAYGDKASFLKMRVEGSFSDYVDFLIKFAPCVVGKKRWNDPCFPMEQVVQGRMDFDRFFTSTDEAFLLLVMDNYRTRWMDEFYDKYHNQNGKMVSWTNNYVVRPAFLSLTNDLV